MARATLAAASLSDNALVAQWIERRFPEPQVVGSTPIEGTQSIDTRERLPRTFRELLGEGRAPSI